MAQAVCFVSEILSPRELLKKNQSPFLQQHRLLDEYASIARIETRLYRKGTPQFLLISDHYSQLEILQLDNTSGHYHHNSRQIDETLDLRVYS